MKRLELRIEDDAHQALRERALSESKSLSAVARELLRRGLGIQREDTGRKRFGFVGSGASGRRDISVHHDEALAEDLK